MTATQQSGADRNLQPRANMPELLCQAHNLAGDGHSHSRRADEMHDHRLCPHLVGASWGLS